MKLQLLLATVFVCALAWAAPAYAVFETNGQPLTQQWGNSLPNEITCAYPCHPGHPGKLSSGPHGGYTALTDDCATCHSVHDAIGSLKLLPGQTVTDSCEVCHDGTGGQGVYGTIEKRAGEPLVYSQLDPALFNVVVGGGHSTDSTKLVPGGSASTGGSLEMEFRGQNGTLTCSDCHSVHGTDLVTAFLGERQRLSGSGLSDVPVTSRLLKRRPGGVATPVNEYGSDWCLGCHAGRVSGTMGLHNHPVESSVTKPVEADRYNYRQLGIVGVGPYPTSTTVLGPGGINTKNPEYNRAYLMPYPRTDAQQGHLPICQQCHEDTRFVGTLTADGTQATPSVAVLSNYLGIFPKADGWDPAAEPRFQNFPHETEGYRLLVEAEATYSTDDLCLNCHPTAALP